MKMAYKVKDNWLRYTQLYKSNAAENGKQPYFQSKSSYDKVISGLPPEHKGV